MRRLSLYVFMVFIFTVPWQEAISIGGSRTLSSLIGVAALVLCLVTCLLEGRIARPTAFIVAFGALVLWQLTTYFWSLDPALTLGKVITMVQLLAMVWLVLELSTTEQERLQMMGAYLLGSAVVCLVIFQYYFSGQAVDGFRYAPATFNANYSAYSIAAGIPMALLIATSRTRGVLKWLTILYVPVAVVAVILTASRSGFIAACVGLLSVFFALRRARPVYRLLWSAMILAVFAGLFFGLPVSDASNRTLSALLSRVTRALSEHSRDARQFGLRDWRCSRSTR